MSPSRFHRSLLFYFFKDLAKPARTLNKLGTALILTLNSENRKISVDSSSTSHSLQHTMLSILPPTPRALNLLQRYHNG